jgi:DNA-binding response OmpR family regulator
MAQQPDLRPVGSRTVLIIEDDPTVLDLIRSVLVDDGLSVETALNGQAALDHDGQSAPDVCVLDMYLPGINGAELVDGLRAKYGSNLPILVTSASIVPNVAHELGAYEYLPKPFDLDQLVAAVQRGLSRNL